ncbi:MAG TPA: tetratricopeptide repeat protein [Gaiellaceae bacterium]|nr:tetratricopeptide repeat protein [Gaiellaceae bacterium]
MDRLRALWDFDDLDASRCRFQEQLEREPDDAGRAEVLTQLARIEGLRGDFDACARLLDRAAAAPVRERLERGRMLRSSGDPAAALPLFEEAYALARETRQWYLAGDAAHMAALAGDMHAWTQRGLELAEQEPDASYWRGPLLNNLGWHLIEAGRHAEAVTAFERALRAREDDPANERALAAAREALAAARDAAGRAAPGR